MQDTLGVGWSQGGGGVPLGIGKDWSSRAAMLLCARELQTGPWPAVLFSKCVCQGKRIELISLNCTLNTVNLICKYLEIWYVGLPF